VTVYSWVPTTDVHVHDKMFHANKGWPASCKNRGLVKLGAGKVRLWGKTDFSCRASCGKRGELHARQLSPAGNLAIGFASPEGSEIAPLCRAPGARVVSKQGQERHPTPN
jgi:hypothetical protein